MNSTLSALNPDRVLVVGTTSDYIQWILDACPDRALFVTDPEIRKKAGEKPPQPNEELVCPLSDLDAVIHQLTGHIQHWKQTITGVVCFDCENMALASRLAQFFNLDYPDVDVIERCRNKHLSKQIWRQNNVPCPDTEAVDTIKDIFKFMDTAPEGLVLKPFFGSGSELVFMCRNQTEAKNAFHTIQHGLKKRLENPLFRTSGCHPHLMLAEKMISGPEFSCDFIVENHAVVIIRMTRKIKSASLPFGTVSGYMIPAHLPENIPQAKLEIILRDGAAALGIQRGICMVDFIVNQNTPVLIEMTPRPGGDCLPQLLKAAGNLDILSLALDFAEKKPVNPVRSDRFKLHVGFRIHAEKGGVLKGVNIDALKDEKRVKSISLSKSAGHVIAMPPEDYDSWLLGHMIIVPDSKKFPEAQSFLMAKRVKVEIES